MLETDLCRLWLQVAERLNFAVIGHPIGHSRSPEIHAAFARQFDISLDYQRIDAMDVEFSSCVERFFDSGGCGMNVTLPHKGAAFAMCSRLSPRATRASAVNTLHRDGQQLTGDNTDGIGLLRDLERLASAHQVAINTQHVLVLGAGGAARGVVAGLLEAGAASIAIAARDATRARSLADLFADQPGVFSLDSVSSADAAFDIVINATSAGLSGESPIIGTAWLQQAWLAYDLGYATAGQRSTPFLQHCDTHGVAMTADGLGMLVEQAAESFFVWHARMPQTAPVLAALRGKAA